MDFKAKWFCKNGPFSRHKHYWWNLITAWWPINKVGTLYICPTPIGNLDDVSQRLIDVLNNVDLIYCEDTRRAKKLLNHFGIETGIESYFIGNEVNKIEDIKSHLGNNLNLALISDAGTPLISDPGNKLVETIIKEGFRVESIPGPSSVLVALTLSGFDISNFQFLGFIPKSGKEKSEFLTKLLNCLLYTSDAADE